MRCEGEELLYNFIILKQWSTEGSLQQPALAAHAAASTSG
jgi:hypothetical protein